MNGGYGARSSPDHAIRELERRLALLDGNGIDPSGGRVGRVESNLRWLIRLGIGTFVAAIVDLALQLAKTGK